MAARAPVAIAACFKQRAVTSQVAGFMRGLVGMSRITKPASKPPESTAEKVAVSFAS